jgi:hypothetical protein
MPVSAAATTSKMDPLRPVTLSPRSRIDVANRWTYRPGERRGVRYGRDAREAERILRTFEMIQGLFVSFRASIRQAAEP